MSGSLRRLAGFQKAAAAGTAFAGRVTPGPNVYLMLQGAGGSVALFVGFGKPGQVELNCQAEGTWQKPTRLPLPPLAGPLDLSVQVAQDAVVLLLAGQPWCVQQLGVPAGQLTGAFGVGDWPEARVGPGPLGAARLMPLLSGPASRMPPSAGGRRRALVACANPAAAVPLALDRFDEVVALAPEPWDMATLVLRFADEIGAGRLHPLPVAAGEAAGPKEVPAGGPFALAAPGTAPAVTVEVVEAPALAAAIGPCAAIYRDAGQTPPALEALARRSVLVVPLPQAQSLARLGCARVSLLRRDPPDGAAGAGTPWIGAGLLPRLAAAPGAGGFLVAGEVGAA